MELTSKLPSKTTFFSLGQCWLDSPGASRATFNFQAPLLFNLAHAQNLLTPTPACFAKHPLPTAQPSPFLSVSQHCRVCYIPSSPSRAIALVLRPLHPVLHHLSRWLPSLHPTPRIGLRPSCLRLLRTLALHEPIGIMYEIGMA